MVTSMFSSHKAFKGFLFKGDYYLGLYSPLPDEKFLDRSKMKQIADNILK